MKDSGGKYWCVQCGEADRRHKASAAGGICAGCGESYSATHMTELGGMPYCDKCLKKKYSGKGAASSRRIGSRFSLSALIPSGGDGQSSFKSRILLAVIFLLILLSLAYNFLHH